jgi:hypothetical protein
VRPNESETVIGENPGVRSPDREELAYFIYSQFWLQRSLTRISRILSSSPVLSCHLVVPEEFKTMMQLRWVVKLTIVAAFTAILTQAVLAQTELKKGVLLLYQVKQLAAQSSTISTGTLADLETDPNFEGGDYRTIFNTASNILSGYRVVKNGGYFPENRGIPRSQQLSVSEVVYYLYSLPDNRELFLYRSPTENTAEYFIRNK